MATSLPDQQLTLAEWQEFIKARTTERGFDNETLQDEFMLLVEEVGELAKAMRPLHGITVATDSTKRELEHEAADVFWLLTCVCNSLGIDLDSAIRSKEAKNNQRVWK